MNILFLLKSLETGGVEVVTAALANEFVKRGHVVCVFSFLGGVNSITGRLDERIRLYEKNDYSVSNDNVSTLRDILIENKIDIIINQWGLPLAPIKTAQKASKGLNTKIISVYHNAPSFNGRIQKLNIALTECDNYIKKLLLKVVGFVFKTITSGAMKYIYLNSDMFMVLSPCYIEEFKKFTGIKEASRLVVMTNPITIDDDNFQYNAQNKEKEIIYVGRLDFVQKRVYRVIDTWNELKESFPDWNLTIVGDGPEKKNIETKVKELDLQRVCFEGFKPPKEYYRRASVLILTSDFEGFPLVLAECMSFGVIPVVYGSFSAVYDIIEDGKDGIIVSKKNGFDARFMAEKIKELLDDKERLNQMALNAVEKSRAFSINRICEQWEKVFSELRVN